ncbi:MAG: acetylglutamate kinase [Archaeoglobaceae archaeon]|nr:acetylglutamate kinase [Archaeoglobaceae archaeon]MCX8152156.1 acetylglutamate kinase [Archaeoglobaceae archaeon]MDW8013872.1 acetylglutamate kinase [Archaeoglobaceae archaeon]
MNVESLIETLHYVKEFQGAKIVIKIGGHAMDSESALEEIVKDIILLSNIGVKPIVVHGGGPEIDEKMEKLGIKPKFVEGFRVTDETTMEIVEMVLDGKINSKIVTKFIKYGGRAVGLSGKDGLLLIAKKKEMKIKKGKEEILVDLGFVGETELVNPEILEILLENNFVPVISPVSADLKGNVYNLNADIAAGDVAAALKAKRLVMMTDVPGLFRDLKDPSTLLRKIKLSELEEFLKNVSGGMKPKLEAVMRALKGGVEKAHIIDSRKNALFLELFTKDGIGTIVEP